MPKIQTNPIINFKMNKITIYSGVSFCKPCVTYSETYKKLQEEFTNVEVHDVDDLAVKEDMFNKGIRSVPTTLFYDKDGKELDRQTGILSYNELSEFLAE